MHRAFVVTSVEVFFLHLFAVVKMLQVQKTKGIHGYYKWCIVPNCTNNSLKTPNKIFVHVPSNTKKRKAWIKAVRRSYSDFSASTKSLYVCEDHFNVSSIY